MNRKAFFPFFLLLAVAGCPEPQSPRPSLIADPPPTDDGGAPGAGLGDLDRGKAYIEKEAWEEALPHLEKALAAQPSNGEIHYYVALVKYKQGDVAAAEAGFAAALEHAPGLTEPRAYLGEIYLSQEPPRAKEAIAVLEPAVKAEPNDAVTRQLLAFAQRVEKRFDASAKHYKAALAIEDDPAVRFQYADMLFEAEKYDQATAEMRKVLPAYSGDVEMVAGIAHRFAKSKAYDDCVKAFDIAIGLKKSEPGFFLHRGICKHELGNEEAARADYNKAIEVNAKFQPAYYYLGMSWLASKKRTQALQALEMAVKLDKNTPVGKAAQEKLVEMKK